MFLWTSPGFKSGVVSVCLSISRFVCCLHTFLPTSQISSVSWCPRGWWRCELMLTQIKKTPSNILKKLDSLCVYSPFQDRKCDVIARHRRISSAVSRSTLDFLTFSLRAVCWCETAPSRGVKPVCNMINSNTSLALGSGHTTESI